MSLEQIRVKKEQVLKIVKANKAKHDSIFKDAVIGFWKSAEELLKKTEKEQLSAMEKKHKEKLKLLRKELKDSKKKLKEQIKQELDCVKNQNNSNSPWVYMTNKYPENHADDYEGTIQKLELCIDKEIELDEFDFDKYIRNKWAWRNSFLESNSSYALTIRSNGNVGIGTTNPSYKLDVNAKVGLGTSTPNNIFNVANSSNSTYITGSSANSDIETF